MKAFVLPLLLALAGCATVAPLPGGSEADAVRLLGAPTSRYPMPGGATRLEFARGPWGRETWMVDIDAGGRITAANQVLNEASFAEFQRRAPGMSRDELLRTLGRPGEVRSGGWQGGQVWSWRYPTNDCLWFQSSVGDDGVVKDGVYGIDPHCDAASDKTR
jgi:hypothetical protein